MNDDPYVSDGADMVATLVFVVLMGGGIIAGIYGVVRLLMFIAHDGRW